VQWLNEPRRTLPAQFSLQRTRQQALRPTAEVLQEDVGRDRKLEIGDDSRCKIRSSDLARLVRDH
jgi:hypothetical protein